MRRYVAFLRAINVGGHTVTMSVLKREFERLGLADVETFIASGNVIFSTRAQSISPIERRIERALEARLGYEVATFVRAEDDVARVAAYQPFGRAEMRQAASLNVGFVGEPLSPDARRVLQSLRTDIDSLHTHDREIYWMCVRKQSESKISNAVLERALRIRSTFRGINTITRLAGKLGGPGAAGRTLT
jgi:uncharacterized protein (DUF1697 family)